MVDASESGSNTRRWFGRRTLALALALVIVGVWFLRASSRVDLPVKVPATAARPYSFALPAGWS